MQMKVGLQVIAGLVVAGSIALLAGCGSAGPKGANPPSQAPAEAIPKIEFSTLVHDFGKAISGDPLAASFAFRNTGQALLVIERVSGG